MSASPDRFSRILRATKVLLIPEHRISTFGDQAIEYSIASPAGKRSVHCRLRRGTVACRRPKILTREALLERFQGFGRDSKRFQRWLEDHEAEKLQGLEYQFDNALTSSTLVKRRAREVADTIRREELDRGAKRSAVLLCPSEGWNLALMKFTLDETYRSVADNVRELQDRGMFDTESRADASQRAEIDMLFEKAAADPRAIKRLGQRLQELGLFEEYEDRFYALLPPEGHA